MTKAGKARSTPEDRASVDSVAPSLHPRPPAGAPSIWDLAQAAHQVRAEAARIDTADRAAWALGVSDTADRRKAEALAQAWDQENALLDLAATLPAETLRDSVALLTWSDRMLEDLGAMLDAITGPPDVCGLKRAVEMVDRLQSVLTNTVPILAMAAGVSVADIGAEHLAERRLWLFGPVGEVAR